MGSTLGPYWLEAGLLAMAEKKKAETKCFGFFKESGGNLLSQKLYNHYHRQDCV
jgi:hypothetical protein